MEITAKLVKELRDKTGAGMMDCKKALVATEGNIKEAIDWLREKGIAKAEKKASRVAAEGACIVETSGNKAIYFEINCETDFVTLNKRFIAMKEVVAEALLASNATTEAEGLQVIVEGEPLSEYLLTQTAAIGEKISFRRFAVVNKEDGQEFGSYVHMGGKIAVLTLLNGGDFETAKDVAMHVAAQNPRYLSQKDISAEELAHETEVLRKTALNENAESAKPKPENIIEKMVVGRLNKNLKEICLLNQEFVKNPDLSVEQYVKSKKASIVSYKRLAVGEGIEKKVDNFVEEVMQQAK
ncbi:MAG: elongation factor Ts [Tenericutes bacterium]|nr:elongation factor Ts [Mycoplasmatota bacterium]